MSDLIETAKKLMALDDFRWWDAMADTDGDRVVDGRAQGRMMIYYFGNQEADHYDASCMATLDLSAPGTQGCIMAWCDEVFGASFHVEPKLTETGGFVYRAHTIRIYRCPLLEVINRSPECPTRIEAACAALLGAR